MRFRITNKEYVGTAALTSNTWLVRVRLVPVFDDPGVIAAMGNSPNGSMDLTITQGVSAGFDVGTDFDVAFTKL